MASDSVPALAVNGADNKSGRRAHQLAAEMGGAGYIITGDHDADVMHDSATINLGRHWRASAGFRVSPKMTGRSEEMAATS